MVSPRIESVGAEPRKGSAVAWSSRYRPRDRWRFMNSTPDMMRYLASTSVSAAPRSRVSAGRGPARCSPLDPPPGQEPVERAADRRLCRRRSFPILELAAPQPSSRPPFPDRSRPGLGPSIASTSWSTAPGPRTWSWLFPASPARTRVRQMTQLINSDVVVHWVLVDSGRLDLGSLTAIVHPRTTWSLHSAAPPRATVAAASLGPPDLGSLRSSGSSMQPSPPLPCLCSRPCLPWLPWPSWSRPAGRSFTRRSAWAGGPAVPHHQVSQHAVRRRERDRPDLGLRSRHPLHPDRRLAAAHQHRRAAPALERPARRHEPGRAAAGTPQLRRQFRQTVPDYDLRHAVPAA